MYEVSEEDILKSHTFDTKGYSYPDYLMLGNPVCLVCGGNAFDLNLLKLKCDEIKRDEYVMHKALR